MSCCSQMIVLYWLIVIMTSSYSLSVLCMLQSTSALKPLWKATFSVLTKIWHCKNHPCIIRWWGASQGCLCVLLWNRSLSAGLVMLWVNYSSIYREHVMLFAEETCWFCSHFFVANLLDGCSSLPKYLLVLKKLMGFLFWRSIKMIYEILPSPSVCWDVMFLGR